MWRKRREAYNERLILAAVPRTGEPALFSKVRMDDPVEGLSLNYAQWEKMKRPTWLFIRLEGRS
jgi:hypothetical protein